MANRDKQQDKGKGKQGQGYSEDRPRAATIAVGHLINPDEDRLVEVSYLPIGVVHSLTMIQAYEEQIETLVQQIRAVQRWYVERAVAKKVEQQVKAKAKDSKVEVWDEEQCEEFIEKEMDRIEEMDELKSKELFIHRFRHAFYQTSRGRDGKFVESLTILADTDLQTRTPDLEDAFRSPLRGQ